MVNRGWSSGELFSAILLFNSSHVCRHLCGATKEQAGTSQDRLSSGHDVAREMGTHDQMIL
jgi:hypothetical protein